MMTEFVFLGVKYCFKIHAVWINETKNAYECLFIQLLDMHCFASVALINLKTTHIFSSFSSKK